MRKTKDAGYATGLPAANVYTVPCPLLRALAVIGGKWKLPILWHLCGGAARYGELKRGVAGITDMMLAQCLRELEADGLVSRRDYGERPPRVEYALTGRGEALLPALRELRAWGEAIPATPETASKTAPNPPAGASPATSPEALPQAGANEPA